MERADFNVRKNIFGLKNNFDKCKFVVLLTCSINILPNLKFTSNRGYNYVENNLNNTT